MVNVGVVGCGGIAGAHLPGLKKNPDVKVVAMADINESIGKKTAQEFGAKFYSDYRKLADEDIEAVFLFPRPVPRVEMCVFFAKQGVHIFSEKPIAIDLRSAGRIVNAVEKSGVKFMVGFVLHFFPAFRKLHELQTSGQLGELTTCWTRRIWYFRGLKDVWYSDPAQSGGMAIDYFGHDIDWLRWTGGEVESIYGRTATVTEGLRCEDNVWAVATFETGGFGVIGGSWSSRMGDCSVGIIGTKGTAAINGDELRMQREGDKEPVVVPYETFNAMEAEDKHFIECLKTGARPEMDVMDGYRSLELGLAIQRSSAKNKVLNVLPGRD